MRTVVPPRPTRVRSRRRHERGPTIALLLLVPGAASPLGVFAAPPAAPRVIVQATADRPVTIRGAIDGLAGDQLQVATSAGTVTVRLVAPVAVTAATRAALQDVVPGTYLGTAARAQPDGTWRAIEVHIFAESLRGTGEGHRPMEAPGTSMTNASVDALVQQADGPLLTLKHKDGVTQVRVPPEAPIVRYAPGDTSLLIPGASVVVFRVTRAADGTLSASRLTVGVDGTRLPM